MEVRGVAATVVVVLLAAMVTAAAASPGCVACGNSSGCAFGEVCVEGGCRGGPQGQPCVEDVDCAGPWLGAAAFLCLNHSCAAVRLPGDLCHPSLPCLGSCQNGLCVARPVGSLCERAQECGIFGTCNASHCIDVPFIGEPCPNNLCQTSAFCSEGVCIPLFLRPVGQNCTADNECVTSALCVDGVCTTVPLDSYASPCPCKSPLRCVAGLCLFTEKDASRLVGCRDLLQESVLCSSRSKCFPDGATNESCSVLNGCYHDLALFRNCLFCNASVPEVTRKVTGACIADECWEPGLSHLIKVSLWVGAVSLALLLASAVIHGLQQRQRKRQYVKI